MDLQVREMTLPETDLIVDYFLRRSTPEHLDMLGIDPARLPRPAVWQQGFRREYELPIEERTGLFLIWLCGATPVGFSSCDTILFGESAYMHLHVTEPQRRRQGIGTACVRDSVNIYFDRLRLERLFCQPNAFNVGPNRTLQKAGFRYLETYMTTPGPINRHQAVTRWVIERRALPAR
jgi:RimJ/RimL family protein N-acetyltransferase